MKKQLGGKLPSLEQGSSILDMGCARGLTTFELAYEYPSCSVVGIDIKRRNIDTANKNLELAKLEGRVYQYYYVNDDSLKLTLDGDSLPIGFFLADGFHTPLPDELYGLTQRKRFDCVFSMNNLYYVLENVDDDLLKERFAALTSHVDNLGYFIFGGCPISGKLILKKCDYIILRKTNDGLSLVDMSFEKVPESERKRDILLEHLTKN